MKSRARSIVSWIVAVLVGLMFIAAGVGKFQMSEAFASRFEAWGYPAGLSPIVGAAELVGGLMVLIPATAVYGAGIIAVVMVGATYTHLATGIGSPMSALIGLTLALILIWLRWSDRWWPKTDS
ncbi:MAG: DoxX family protein [Thermoanaerobaculia bacterium]|nr:DoxX family protein [Thermoanaerobaculia bacterium]